MATTASRKNMALKEAMTKTQILEALSESTGLQKKDVPTVLDQLGGVIERHVSKRAVGTFTLPDLLKIKVVRKPATKARKMMSPVIGANTEARKLRLPVEPVLLHLQRFHRAPHADGPAGSTALPGNGGLRPRSMASTAGRDRHGR